MKTLSITCFSIYAIFATTYCSAAPDFKGRIFRQKEDGLEMVVRSQISPGSVRTPSLSSDLGFVVEPDDVITYRVYLRNVSQGVIHLISNPEFGFREFGRDFRYSCDPQYVDGSFVRIATPRLFIVDLKPGEFTFMGEVQYTCQEKEMGENSFMYSISKVMTAEYGVWSGSILCRTPFSFREATKSEEDAKQANIKKGTIRSDR